jgi:glucosylceramidase
MLWSWTGWSAGGVELWLTDPDKGVLFQKQPAPLTFEDSLEQAARIEIDGTRSYQSIDGFGYTLTGGSAMLLMRMAPAAREAILRELFTTESTGIGTSYLRVSIGASDLNERVFSYNDLPRGQTDPTLARFSLGPDLQDVVPVLKQILALNPEIKIMGSPWSAPPWMKTNEDFRGGSLKRECFAVYANYFVKYIQAMKAEGIRIDAITVQNEPLHPGNNPSMLMLAPDQAEFVRDHLGPAFKAAQIDTKIIIYDHNCDRPDYPLTVLKDPEARKYIDGSAFHHYAGTIDALSQVHDAFPDKHLYFTEQWIGAPGNLRGDLNWHIRTLVVGASRNWSRTVLQWNLAADPQHKPHTDRGGCTRCLGAITIDGDKVTRNPAYYIIAHPAKFVRPGSVRIESNAVKGLPNVAFRTPANQLVLIVQNDNPATQSFGIRYSGKTSKATLNSGAVGTFVWSKPK